MSVYTADTVNRGNAMRSHTVGTKEEWATARQDLLEREKELGALDEESAKQRQELPPPYYSQLLDQIPAGRDADFPLRRHDEY